MDKPTLDKALAAIEKGSSLSAVSEFLRGKGVSHSAGSWEQMFDRRIRPALDAGDLSDDDIRILVREAEDFGRQHVFLYEPTDENTAPASLTKVDRVKRFLRKQGWEGLVDSMKMVGIPAGIELVDVHFDGSYVSFKFAERRNLVLQEREETQAGDTILRTVKDQVRAIDVVTLRDSGQLEFRIAMITGTPDYLAIANELWTLLDGFLSRDNFKERELSKLRKKFAVNPTAAVKALIRVRMASGQDTDGIKFGLSSKPSGDLLQSERAVNGFATLAGSTARIGHVSVGFLPQKSGTPRRELGVIFTAGVNEIRVIPSCTEQEYDYIREQIAKYS